MNVSRDLAAVWQRLEADEPHALERLKQLLTIPSVSTDPAYAEHVAAAAGFLDSWLRQIGLDSHVHTTAGHPIVFASNSDDDLPADAPHVLFYGHYDVQPPDPVEQWVSPPFKPQVREGALYARGASDDKGPVCSFLEAIQAWKQECGKLPVRVTLVIEGEEECGSRHLRQFLESHSKALRADVALIADTTMWDPYTVAITYGLRGLLYYEVKLHGPRRDLHSGMYGGVLANPAVMLTQVLGKLFDDQHRVTIPGFYDEVEPLTDAERESWEKLGFDEMQHCLGPIGVTKPFGEAGYSTLERKWARPACDINGLFGGYGGAGAKTVIPSVAGAKVSFRLAPNQNAAKIAAAFEAWLKRHDVHGCHWELTNLGEAPAALVARDSPWMAAAADAVALSSGKEPVLVREGATIPVVGWFKSMLNLDSLLLGFALTDDAIHSPNEKFNLGCFHLAARTQAALLDAMSKVRR